MVKSLYKKHIILIGNYSPDSQESMERFAIMLQEGFKLQNLKVELWKPNVLIGKWSSSTNKGFGKWLGYIDKWILFPFILRWRFITGGSKFSETQFHICDHSNAPYLKYFPQDQVSITCHDVLAIRGAFGYTDAYCSASKFGIILQKWILRNLLKAKTIIAVSNFTMKQLKELAARYNVPAKNWLVILNGFNAEFNPVKPWIVNRTLIKQGLNPEQPFILHVGSQLERKNRKLLLQMVDNLSDRWNGKIYYAGKALDPALIAQANDLGLSNRIVSIVKPSHQTLLALYSKCEAFIFPSFSEGFGWPLIEAQACGAPVIASNYEPMPEVSGGAALHCNPENPAAFAKAFLSLNDVTVKTKLVKDGFKNTLSFQRTDMINAYLELFAIDKESILCFSN